MGPFDLKKKITQVQTSSNEALFWNYGKVSYIEVLQLHPPSVTPFPGYFWRSRFVLAHCVLFCLDLTWPGFPGGSDSKRKKKSICNAGDLGSIPGLGRSPGGGHGNPLQYSCLENPREQRSLAGYSPQRRKKSDTTEHLSTHALWTNHICGCLALWHLAGLMALPLEQTKEQPSICLSSPIPDPFHASFIKRNILIEAKNPTAPTHKCHEEKKQNWGRGKKNTKISNECHLSFQEVKFPLVTMTHSCHSDESGCQGNLVS